LTHYEYPGSPPAVDDGDSKSWVKSPKYKVTNHHHPGTPPAIDERLIRPSIKSPRYRNKKLAHDLSESHVVEDVASKPLTKLKKKKSTRSRSKSKSKEETRGRPKSLAVEEGSSKESSMRSKESRKLTKKKKKKAQGRPRGSEPSQVDLPKLVPTDTSSSDCPDDTLGPPKVLYAYDDADSEADQEEADEFFQRYGIEDVVVTDVAKDNVTSDATDNAMDDEPDGVVEEAKVSFSESMPPTQDTYSGETEYTSAEDTMSRSSTMISTPTITSPKQRLPNFFSRILCTVCKIDEAQNLDYVDPLMLTDTIEYDVHHASYSSNTRSGDSFQDSRYYGRESESSSDEGSVSRSDDTDEGTGVQTSFTAGSSFGNVFL